MEGVQMLSDPRVFFAAERTLLAWARTGLTIMAFGFVVARFGLFVHLLMLQAGDQQAARQVDLSKPLGIALVLIGVGCFVLGAIQHRSYVASLPPQDVPRTHSAVYPVGLSVILAVLGVILAVYLAQ